MNSKINVALQQQIQKAGGATKVGIAIAKKMKRKRPFTRQAVVNWYAHFPAPPKIAIALEAVLGLPRAKIRPDLW